MANNIRSIALQGAVVAGTAAAAAIGWRFGNSIYSKGSSTAQMAAAIGRAKTVEAVSAAKAFVMPKKADEAYAQA